jgi:D-alanine-D-alanine ligase
MATRPARPGDNRRTLGPIADLERHIPPEWWRTVFDSLYLKTDGDVYENAENTRADVDALIRVGSLEPDDRILDLCCGQGRHCIELARRGFHNLTGVDRSRYLIRIARARAKRDGLAIDFHEGDARKIRLTPSWFHCVTILGNSFGYFEHEADDLAVLRAAQRVLRTHGLLVLDLPDGAHLRERFEARSWEWIDADHFVCRERTLSSDGSRLVSREVVVNAERGVIADQFYAERLYAADQISEMLGKAGFEEVERHADVETRSERNQDLGMMARRICVTARAPNKPLHPARGAARLRDVTVLLGDPSLPDAVKLGGQFNSEDFDTVAKLKAALAELGGFSFSYVDRHDDLFTRLRDKPPELVLNLCDEGYRNEATWELHVPAMLELLGIPYSGAGPRCLGLCYNKALVNAIAASLEIPVPSETYFDPADQSATIPTVLPALVKPNTGDSSVGITDRAVVDSAEELVAYVSWLERTLPGRALLVQEFLSGREFSVGVIGNPGYAWKVLPLLEVDYSGLDRSLPRLLTHASKWDPTSPYWTQIKYREADLDETTRRLLVDRSLELFERLECRDYARIDFRMDAEGTPKLLEVNPNPGWCWDGKLNLMASFDGMSYADLLRLILEAAQGRLPLIELERGPRAKGNGLQPDHAG